MVQRYTFPEQTVIGNAGDPTLAQDLTTKAYVDARGSGTTGFNWLLSAIEDTSVLTLWSTVFAANNPVSSTATITLDNATTASGRTGTLTNFTPATGMLNTSRVAMQFSSGSTTYQGVGILNISDTTYTVTGGIFYPAAPANATGSGTVYLQELTASGVLTGGEVPANTLGFNGQFYFNTAQNLLYFKNGGLWAQVTGNPLRWQNAGTTQFAPYPLDWNDIHIGAGEAVGAGLDNPEEFNAPGGAASVLKYLFVGDRISLRNPDGTIIYWGNGFAAGAPFATAKAPMITSITDSGFPPYININWTDGGDQAAQDATGWPIPAGGAVVVWKESGAKPGALFNPVNQIDSGDINLTATATAGEYTAKLTQVGVYNQDKNVLVAGSNVQLSSNDTNQTITISALPQNGFGYTIRLQVGGAFAQTTGTESFTNFPYIKRDGTIGRVNFNVTGTFPIAPSTVTTNLFAAAYQSAVNATTDGVAILSYSTFGSGDKLTINTSTPLTAWQGTLQALQLTFRDQEPSPGQGIVEVDDYSGDTQFPWIIGQPDTYSSIGFTGNGLAAEVSPNIVNIGTNLTGVWAANTSVLTLNASSGTNGITVRDITSDGTPLATFNNITDVRFTNFLTATSPSAGVVSVSANLQGTDPSGIWRLNNNNYIPDPTSVGSGVTFTITSNTVVFINGAPYPGLSTGDVLALWSAPVETSSGSLQYSFSAIGTYNSTSTSLTGVVFSRSPLVTTETYTGNVAKMTPANQQAGGLTTQFQFNDNGAFAGASGLTYDKTNNLVSAANAPTDATNLARLVDIQTAQAGLKPQNPQTTPVHIAESNVTGTYANNSGATAPRSTITGLTNVALTVAGLTPAVNNDVLLVNQTDGIQNGSYILTQQGSATQPYILTRTSIVPSAGNFWVADATGATNYNRQWVNTNVGTVTIGTTIITYSPFNAAGSVPGLDQVTAIGANSTRAFGSLQTGGNGVLLGVAGAGIAPAVTATGADTNITLQVQGKGTGSVILPSQRANQLTITGADAGGAPSINATGVDAAIGMNFTAKSTGRIAFTSNTIWLASRQANFIEVNSAVSGAAPSIQPAGIDTDIGLSVSGLGNGTLNLCNSFANYFELTGSSTGGVNITAAGTATNRAINLQVGGSAGVQITNNNASPVTLTLTPASSGNPATMVSSGQLSLNSTGAIMIASSQNGTISALGGDATSVWRCEAILQPRTSLNLNSGSAATPGYAVPIITANGIIPTALSPGNANDVLVSRGANLSPAWVNSTTVNRQANNIGTWSIGAFTLSTGGGTNGTVNSGYNQQINNLGLTQTAGVFTGWVANATYQIRLTLGINATTTNTPAGTPPSVQAFLIFGTQGAISSTVAYGGGAGGSTPRYSTDRFQDVKTYSFVGYLVFGAAPGNVQMTFYTDGPGTGNTIALSNCLVEIQRIS